METEDGFETTCPCSISLTLADTFTIHGSKRGGFAKNVLDHMPPGPWYTMTFDEDAKKLMVERRTPPWIKNDPSL